MVRASNSIYLAVLFLNNVSHNAEQKGRYELKDISTFIQWVKCMVEKHKCLNRLDVKF